MQPIAVYYKDKRIEYLYEALKFNSNPTTIYNILTDVEAVLNPVIPTILDVPPVSQQSEANYEIQISLAAALVLQDAINGSYQTNLDILQYGIVVSSASGITVNGNPIRLSFTKDQTIAYIGKAVNFIDITNIQAELSYDTSQLITSGVYTPDPTSAACYIRGHVTAKVVASWQ